MRIALLGMVMVSAACALRPAPVPVSGPVPDVQALVGQWTGEYRSAETGRSGSILFTLEAGKDTAHGDIVMVARELDMTYDDALRVATMRQAANQVLTIRFVRVVGDVVTGTIDAYPDPDPHGNCELLTVFRGRLSGRNITGTYRTTHAGHDSPVQRGTWSVTRSK